jgi:hypothetical protein
MKVLSAVRILISLFFPHQLIKVIDPSRNIDFPRTATGASKRRRGSMHTGFGGFPTPYRLLIKFVSWVAPDLAERIRLRVTVPRTRSGKLKETKSIASQTIEAAIKTEHKMIEKDLEYLGGVEYQALKLLRTIVIAVSKRTTRFVAMH